MSGIMTSSVLLSCSMALIFLMWRTNSLRTNLSTTVFIVTIGTTSLLHMFNLHTISLYLIVIVMGALVWREIPHENIDKWKKK